MHVIFLFVCVAIEALFVTAVESEDKALEGVLEKVALKRHNNPIESKGKLIMPCWLTTWQPNESSRIKVRMTTQAEMGAGSAADIATAAYKAVENGAIHKNVFVAMVGVCGS